MQDDELKALVAYLQWYANHVVPFSAKTPRSKLLEAATALETLARENAKLKADIQAMLIVHANDKAERELHERAYESCANDLEYCRAERDEARAENAELRKEVDRTKYDGIHTCYDQCQRPACVARRERDQTRAEVERLREFERHVTVEGMETANRYWEARYRDETAQLTATQARLEEAVEVVKPFAKAGKIRLCGGDDYWTGDKSIQGTDLAFHVKFSDLRRATAFLAKQENPNG